MTSSILQISVAWVSISTDSLHSSLLYIYNIWNLLSMWIIPHSIYSVLTIYWLLSSPCLTGTAVCFFVTFSISSWCVCVELFCTVSNLLDCFFYPCAMLFPPIHHFTHNPSAASFSSWPSCSHFFHFIGFIVLFRQWKRHFVPFMLRCGLHVCFFIDKFCSLRVFFLSL